MCYFGYHVIVEEEKVMYKTKFLEMVNIYKKCRHCDYKDKYWYTYFWPIRIYLSNKESDER